MNQWYVLRAVFKSELRVRDALRRAGFRAYVPMRWEIMVSGGRKLRRLVPAITELVFVYSTAEAITDFKSHCRDTVYWLTRPSLSGNRRYEKIVVSEKAMNDFIRITEQTESNVAFFRPEELRLNKGDRIRIHGGVFDGVEGVLLKVKGRREKQLVVEIADIAAVAVTVQPEVVELMSVGPGSVDRQWAARELQRLSTQMLTAAPDKEHSLGEWEMLNSEIRRLYESLRVLKGYLPSLEGEMALALLLAETALGMTVSEETSHRYEAAIAKLRTGSRLRLKMEQVKSHISEDFCSFSNLIL